MRLCACCQRAPREDDPMSTIFVDSQVSITVGFGGVSGCLMACSPCAAIAKGDTLPLPKRYMPGERVPQKSSGGDIRVCGVCRRAFFEDDRLHVMRLLSVDIDCDWIAKPGVHMSCAECLRKYRPKILNRLIREGHAPLSMTEQTMPEDMLL